MLYEAFLVETLLNMLCNFICTVLVEFSV